MNSTNGQTLSETKIQDLLQRQIPVQATRPLLFSYHPAAVLIPLLLIGNDWHLLFIRRTEQVQDHKGQVAFPGGRMEPDDPDLEATALREAGEEIGLLAGDVKVLGRLPDLPTVSHYLITPVVGHIRWPLELKLSESEVSRAFIIPLTWLAEPTHWLERPYRRSDGRVEDVIFFEVYQDELLWGVTAQITINFMRALQLIE